MKILKHSLLILFLALVQNTFGQSAEAVKLEQEGQKLQDENKAYFEKQRALRYKISLLQNSDEDEDDIEDEVNKLNAEIDKITLLMVENEEKLTILSEKLFKIQLEEYKKNK